MNSVSIDQADLNVIIDSLEKNFALCDNVKGYFKRLRIEELLGKLYQFQNNHVIINPGPVEPRIKVKVYKRKYVIK